MTRLALALAAVVLMIAAASKPRTLTDDDIHGAPCSPKRLLWEHRQGCTVKEFFALNPTRRYLTDEEFLTLRADKETK